MSTVPADWPWWVWVVLISTGCYVWYLKVELSKAKNRVLHLQDKLGWGQLED